MGKLKTELKPGKYGFLNSLRRSIASAGLRLLLFCAPLPFSSCGLDERTSSNSVRASDTENVERDFKRYRTKNVDPKYVLKINDPDDEVIDDLVSALNNVPDAIQDIINKKGGKVWIFDQDSKISRNLEAINAGGEYFSEFKRALTPHCSREYCINVALHEYGHMVANLLGDIDERQDFNELYRFSLERRADSFSIRGWEKRREYGKKSAVEFFATSFAEYYTSPESRSDLKMDFPEVHDYFARLEQKVVISSELGKSRVRRNKLRKGEVFAVSKESSLTEEVESADVPVVIMASFKQCLDRNSKLGSRYRLLARTYKGKVKFIEFTTELPEDINIKKDCEELTRVDVGDKTEHFGSITNFSNRREFKKLDNLIKEYYLLKM